jgi:hypothetical protein
MNIILKKKFVVFLLLISIYVLFVIYNKKPKKYRNNNVNEGFTSGFREMYRPRVRRARLIVEGYFNKAKNNFQLFLKKFGIV